MSGAPTYPAILVAARDAHNKLLVATAAAMRVADLAPGAERRQCEDLVEVVRGTLVGVRALVEILESSERTLAAFAHFKSKEN